MEPGLCAGLPLIAAFLHAVWGGRRGGAGSALPWVGVAAAALAAGVAGHLAWTVSLAQGPLGQGPIGEVAGGGPWLTDRLALLAALLVSILGVAAALLAIPWVAAERAAGRLGSGGERLHGAGLQAVLGFTLLGLLAGSPALTAAAAGAATLAGAATTVLGRTQGGGAGSSGRAGLACWRQVAGGTAATLLALGGTVLLALAAGPGAAPGWTALPGAATRMAGPALGIAGALLLVGFGALAGLVPLQAGLPDAQARGPLPVAGLLGLLVPTLALITLLRLRVALDVPGSPLPPGEALLVAGLASVLLGGFAMWRRGDIRRQLATAALWQNGVVATAFGLGGPGAVYAGVLHLVLHGLAHAAGQAALAARGDTAPGTVRVTVRGTAGGAAPARRLPLVVAVLCLSGLAPVGMFASAFLVVTEALRRAPVVGLPLGLGLLLGGWGLLARLSPVLGGHTARNPGTVPDTRADARPSGPLVIVPCWALLALVVVLSLAMPPVLANWLTTLAETTAR